MKNFQNDRSRFVVFLLVAALALTAASALVSEESVDRRTVVYRMDIEGMIHDGITSKLELALDQAVAGGAEALVIQMDTPGGVLDSTRDIVKLMLNAPLPVMVWVGPSGAHAGSAGVMLTMAAHIAAMAPGTNIGAATPVSMQGEIPETMKKKVTNDTAAFVEAIAEQRDRNTEWAIKAVRDAESITDSKALEINVIDIIANSVEDLLAQADGRTVKINGEERTLVTKFAGIIEVQLGWKEKAMVGFANPSLAFGLLLLAVLGIYVEFSNPGLIFPGALGVLCAILFLFSIQILPFNYLGILVIALGLVLFALEMKFTSYGLLTIGGIACLTFGSLLLFDVPQDLFDPRTAREFRVPLSLVLPSTISLGTLVALVMFFVIRTHRRQVLTAAEGMVNELGTVKGDLTPGVPGQVFLHGEYWRAITDEPIAGGETVRVTDCHNLTVRVARLNPNREE